jgi:GTP pyrophosphokinase
MATVKETAQTKPNGLIGRAYAFAEKAHKGQKRKSGEPYFNHLLATAETLASWHLDEGTIAAGLLHDSVEDTQVTREELRSEFGDEIDFLVDGVTKLSHLKYRGAQAKVENLRKLIFALSEDLRVIFIKLADRLHNMSTLDAVPKEKQRRIALETNDIYAPIAYRLGMQNLSGELQELSFPYLYPQESKWLLDTVKDRYREREEYLLRIKPMLDDALTAHRVKPYTIDFRAKRYSSLYYKLLYHNMDIERIYDLIAMRIVVDTVPDCYAALGAVHKTWPPLPGRIKDYIAMPKPNGYRSLHTTVIGPDQKIVEIQIRTKAMHEENENGIAAHWLYEQYKKSGINIAKPTSRMAEEVRWVQQLRTWQEKYTGDGENHDEFLESMKVDFFKDRIFGITPKGDVIDLPLGSTPIDFAYHIHSQVGNTCVAAKVNGTFAPLDHQLRSGDLVEILVQKNKKPSEDWLAFVKTTVAHDHIRAALRAKDQRLRAKREPSKVEFKLTIQNRLGLIRDISGLIARTHFHITSVNTMKQSTPKFTLIRIECELREKDKMEHLLRKLKGLKEVREVSYRVL